MPWIEIIAVNQRERIFRVIRLKLLKSSFSEEEFLRFRMQAAPFKPIALSVLIGPWITWLMANDYIASVAHLPKGLNPDIVHRCDSATG